MRPSKESTRVSTPELWGVWKSPIQWGAGTNTRIQHKRPQEWKQRSPEGMIYRVGCPGQNKWKLQADFRARTAPPRSRWSQFTRHKWSQGNRPQVHQLQKSVSDASQALKVMEDIEYPFLEQLEDSTMT